MTSLPSLRRLRSGGGLGFILTGIGALLLHCSWVLLNGSSVIYRLWTVLGKVLSLFWCKRVGNSHDVSLNLFLSLSHPFSPERGGI